jgi:WhiB family redox-sensing transcriptional regulator
MDWRHRAACRGEDPEVFFPTGSTGPVWRELDRAIAICADCSVRERCLQWALETGQDAGVWGGLSELERRSISRGRIGRHRAS